MKQPPTRQSANKDYRIAHLIGLLQRSHEASDCCVRETPVPLSMIPERPSIVVSSKRPPVQDLGHLTSHAHLEEDDDDHH